MKRHTNAKKNVGGTIVLWATILMFATVALVLCSGTTGFAESAGNEGVRATYEAIERATVLCYATEGFYPPGLAYIKDHYGVEVDESRYAVRYEVYAANVMPVIRVSAR